MKNNNNIENNLLKNALLDLNGVATIIKEGAKGATKDLMKESFREVMSELITSDENVSDNDDNNNEVKDTTSNTEKPTSDEESSLDLDNSKDDGEEDAEWSRFAKKYNTGVDNEGNEEYDFTRADDADIERVSDLLKDTDKVKVVQDGEVYRLEDGENEFLLIQTKGNEDNFSSDLSHENENADELSFDLFLDGDAEDDSETEFEITTDTEDGNGSDEYSDTFDVLFGDTQGNSNARANDTAEEEISSKKEKPLNDDENKIKKESKMRNTYELVLEDDDLGYTDNYQKTTATTFPKNEQGDFANGCPINGTGEYGDHTDKKAHPFEEDVNEGLEFDLFLNERIGTRNGGTDRGKKMTLKSETQDENSPEGQQVIVKADANATRLRKAQDESIMRKTNKILRENNQLKNALGKFEKDLTEASVANINLQHIVRLVTENTTSAKEKKSIVKQFSKVKTIAESKMLYNAIKRTLNGGATKNGINESIAKPIAVKPSTANEKVIYKSKDLNESLDLMSRMNKVKL